MYIVNQLEAAGPLLWVLALLSVYVLYVFFWRLQVLSGLRQNPETLLKRAFEALSQGDLGGAVREASRLRIPASNVLRAGLGRFGAGVEASRAAMNEALLVEEDRLFKGLSGLGTVAQIAPLFGLLGTVFGMIRAFTVFAHISTPTAAQLAGGISEALFNTAGGLIVAITAYAARNYLRTRAEGALLDAERVVESLPSWLRDAKNHHPELDFGLEDGKSIQAEGGNGNPEFLI
jgi:biopolymer transport protein ExbB